MNWHYLMMEKTLESLLDCKEIKPVNPEENQSWIFFGRTDAEAEAPILCPPDAKSWLIRKDPDAGKDWRKEKGMTEDEMVGWHHQLNGRVWVSSGKWGRKGKLDVLQSMGSQRVKQYWATKQQQCPWVPLGTGFKHSFLVIVKWYSIVWLYQHLFTHSLGEVHLGCFQPFGYYK